MSTEIERLEELRKQQKELYEMFHIQRREAAVKLYSLFTDLNQGPLALYPLRDDAYVQIDDSDWPRKEGFVWKVTTNVKFVNQDPDKTGYDFGSDFELYITNLEIRVNHGSCGEWGLEDKGQWSRLLLMKNIFDHQDDIIRELNQIINIAILKELGDVNIEIDRINRVLREAKDKEEREATLKLLKPGLYISSLGRHWVYSDHDYNTGHYEYHYYGHQKIIKVTEASVFTHDVENNGFEYTWITHRRKLKDIVWQLNSKRLYLIEDINQTPPEVEASE